MRVLTTLRDFTTGFWRGAKAGYSRGFAERQAIEGHMAAPPMPPAQFHGVETPGYAVLRQIGDAEVRRYGLRLYVQTTLAGLEQDLTDAKAQLAAYHAGGNRKGKIFAPTTPLLLSQEGKHVFLRMGLPAICNTSALPDAVDMSLRFSTAHASDMLVMALPVATALAQWQEVAQSLRAVAVDAGLEPLPDALLLLYEPAKQSPWSQPKAEVALIL